MAGMFHGGSVVIYDFYIACIAVLPFKTDTPLVVDPDAVLTGTSPLEGFQPVARRHPQRVQIRSGIDHQQFAARDALNVVRQFSGVLTTPDLFSFCAGKTLDHFFTISRGDIVSSAIRSRCRNSWKTGAEDGTRTRDLLITNQLLYQLSYFGFY